MKPVWKEDGQALPSCAYAGFASTDPELRQIFGDDGIMANCIDNYKTRPQQLHLANQIRLSINARRHLVGEAGTGTGKSLAYLVPSVLHALTHNKKVLVCTANLTLQDQLKNKDLPLLQRVLGPYLTEKFGRNFRWSLMKGKNNYLCLSKFHYGQQPMGFEQDYTTLLGWMRSNECDGDLAEVQLPFTRKQYRPLKQAITVNDTDECRGRKACDEGMDCFYFKAKDKMETADVIVANHHLLVRHFESGGAIFPPFDVVIIDEAHQFEEIVRNQRQKNLDSSVFQLLNKCDGKLTNDNKQYVKEAKEAFDELFKCLSQICAKRQNRGEAQTRLFKRYMTAEAVKCCARVVEQLPIIATLLTLANADELASKVNELGDAVRSLAECDAKWCFWGEPPDKSTSRYWVIKAQPIEIDDWCKHVMSMCPWVFVSATLATSANVDSQFSYFKATHGIEFCSEVNAGSPFDYRLQSMYYIPPFSAEVMERQNGGEDPDYTKRWAEMFANEYEAVIEAAEGRTLALFTSSTAMEQMHFALKERRLRWPQRYQDGSPPAELISWFKSTPGAVLLATKSFWEGVDIQGEALSAVIIDRIPFNPPNDPVFAARSDKHGKKGFFKLSVPHATIALKQAIGRGVRTEMDRALIALMDTRFLHKAYGTTMLQSFPGSPTRNERSSVLITRADFEIVTLWLNRGKRLARTAEEFHAAQALEQLANVCDGASSYDYQGFNKVDADFGRDLSHQLSQTGRLSNKQWDAAVRLVAKYWRQVGKAS